MIRNHNIYGLVLLQEDCVTIDSEESDSTESRVDPFQSRVTLTFVADKEIIWGPQNPKNELWDKKDKLFQVIRIRLHMIYNISVIM